MPHVIPIAFMLRPVLVDAYSVPRAELDDFYCVDASVRDQEVADGEEACLPHEELLVVEQVRSSDLQVVVRYGDFSGALPPDPAAVVFGLSAYHLLVQQPHRHLLLPE